MRSVKQTISMSVHGGKKLLDIKIIVVEEDDGSIIIQSEYGGEIKCGMCGERNDELMTVADAVLCV